MQIIFFASGFYDFLIIICYNESKRRGGVNCKEGEKEKHIAEGYYFALFFVLKIAGMGKF